MEKYDKLNFSEYASIKIAIIYAGFSALWILLSDQILYFMIKNPEILTKIQMIKGWVFILFSAFIIFFLLRKEIRKYSQTEAALRKSEKEIKNHAENLKIIFNSTPNILVLVNNENRVEMVNHRGAAFLGKKKENILGLLGGEVFNCLNSFDGEGCGRNPGCSQCPVRTRVTSTFQTGEPHSEEEGRMTFLISGKETSMDFLISTELLKLDGVSNVLLSLSDITDRKQAEEKALHFNRIFEESLNEIYLFDADTLKFTQVNSAAQHNLGYTMEELQKLTPLDFKPEFTAESFAKQVAPLRKGEKGEIVFETVHKRKNQSLYDVEIHLQLLKSEYKTIFVAIILDITDRKKLKLQLQQAQKMEAIGTLAGGIAHDFNNILFPIIGHTEMLLEDVPEDSPSRSSLEGIYTGALRARELVKQILTFSRQDSNELMLMKIQPIIKEALKLIRSSIPTTIKIKQNINPACGVIKGDPTQIHQIIMNLATNAYHAMEETGGELTVNLKEIELGEYDVITPDMTPGVYAFLTVADTGVGLDKDLTEKIFIPFFTTKEKGKGTGMGLSVVHGIVKNMNGTIRVYSEPGKGTEFKVYFPLEKSSFEKQNIQTHETIQGGMERVLLVDDEDAVVRMEKQMLERLGYQVATRTSSIEALEAFRANPGRFDLIITDMQMPDMAGDKLSVELIKIRPDIPVLLCTGFSEILSEEKAALLGIKGFLLKPIVMKDLAQKIREVLDGLPEDELNEINKEEAFND